MVTIEPDDVRHPVAQKEHQLVEAAQRNPRDFAPLYEAYVDLVWRYAMSRIGDRERALDSTSQTFAKALANLSSYRIRSPEAPGAFRSWLMTIARNVVIDDLRRHRSISSLDHPEIGSGILDLRYLPEDLAVTSESVRELIDAVAALSPLQQRIVRLRLTGMRSREIADILQTTAPAVDAAFSRAMQRLRQSLATTRSR